MLVRNYTDDNTISLSKDKNQKNNQKPKNVAISRFFQSLDRGNKLGPVGLEPTTKRLRVSCATNCATSPYVISIAPNILVANLALFVNFFVL